MFKTWKLVCFILSCAILFGCLTGASAVNLGRSTPSGNFDNTKSAAKTNSIVTDPIEDNYYGVDEETYEIMQKQNPARNAHREFMSHLEKNIEGEVIYPDTFAGSYIDNETYRLCIALTDCSQKITSEYNKYFSEPSTVEYISAKYSYNYLSELREDVESDLDNISTICIDQKQNIVKVGVNDPSLLNEQMHKQMAYSEDFPVQIYYSEDTKNVCR